MIRRLILALLFCVAAGAAHATSFTVASCPSLPYTLTNGTLADATQVMADFNALLTCINTGGTVSSAQITGPGGGTVTIQNPSATGAYNFNLPATAGTAGQFLTSGGGGGTAETWTTLPTANLLGGAGASGFVGVTVGTGLSLAANTLTATGGCTYPSSAYILYSTGSTCAGDSKFQWDATNHQLNVINDDLTKSYLAVMIGGGAGSHRTLQIGETVSTFNGGHHLDLGFDSGNSLAKISTFTNTDGLMINDNGSRVNMSCGSFKSTAALSLCGQTTDILLQLWDAGVRVQQGIVSDAGYFSAYNGITQKVQIDANGANYLRGGVVGLSPGYTVSGLPAATVGDYAYVTDQLTACAAAGAALTGGGAVKCPVFYNGSAWVGG